MSKISARDAKIEKALLKHHLNILRLGAGTGNHVVKQLREVEKDLVAMVYKAPTQNKTKINAIIKEARTAIAERYTQIDGYVSGVVNGIPAIEAAVVRQALEEAYEGNIAIKQASASLLAQSLKNTLIAGASPSDWWARQGKDVDFRFAGALRRGSAMGETAAQTIERVTGPSGFMRIAERNAKGLAETVVQAAANNARDVAINAARDVILGVVWRSELDDRVCEICAAKADMIWDMDGEPQGHNIAFENPPAHFGCRCELMPITVHPSDLGLNIHEAASIDRPTFAEFLEDQGKGFQDNVLGEGRAKLWRDGTISLQSLLDLRGNPMTLDELKNKYNL